nr:MAG TPA: hypothetical protein [Caudoviricetes sp.]
MKRHKRRQEVRREGHLTENAGLRGQARAKP